MRVVVVGGAGKYGARIVREPPKVKLERGFAIDRRLSPSSEIF
jgi:hypothetical protein